MVSRNLQDAFMDDSDESCPLCVEEFDLSDKNFRPCPCGYQVCQFCYNNIKNNMNGLCPACRRPYDEQSIEWKIVSPEEQKADIELQARKKAAARKKESERKQVETNNRKHLAGLRVVQKNLVYVVGLSQKSNEEEFLQTLRGDQYFGQYGKIIKIVVSKAKEGSHNNNTVGVYVTFERREDAAKCIAAVDGSKNLDRPLRAQYGTTKYCSAYLRNEQCQNRNCTFLHETGEDYDSFSRQDLSSMNAMSTQRPAQAPSSSVPSKQQPPQPQPPPQQAPQNISAASQSIPQQISRDEAMSRSDSGDGPALPSSANWAARNAAVESRRSSKPASVSAPSPVITSSNFVSQPAEPQLQPETQSLPHAPHADSPIPRRTTRPKSPHPMERAMNVVASSSFKITFDRSLWSEEDLKVIDAFPPLFSLNGGHMKYEMEREQEQMRLMEEEDRNVMGAISAAEEDENPASGSLQLGGEPEAQGEHSENSGRMSAQQRQPPYSATSTSFPFGGSSFQTSTAANLPRTLTPQQQHQLSLLRSSASNRQSPVNHGQFQQGYGQNTSSLHQHQQSNPFQMQMQNQGFGSGQAHARQASRYTFANDSASASTAIKPAANPQLMAQQSAMMPPSQGKQFQQSNIQNNHFYSGVQGPPPGLKSSGTPPISGGGMFGQGHGFASAMGGSAGFSGNTASKNTNEELMRDLLRTRNGSLTGQGSELGKRELNKFPFTHQQPMTSDAPASSLLSSLYGPQLGSHQGYQDHSLQKQKKKGKKHRHANTSSSGGGGIVDLADPSILQARMHHGGAGQGQYGAQGQEPSEPFRFSNAAFRADDLAAEATNIISDSQPVRSGQPQMSSISSPVPPGISSAQDFPPLAAPSQPAVPPKLQRKVTTRGATPVIKPVVPVVASTLMSTTENTKQQPFNDLTSMKDESSGSAAEGPRNDIDSSKPLSKVEAKKPDSKLDEPTAHFKMNKKPSPEKRGRPDKLNLAAVGEKPKQGNASSKTAEDSKAKADAMFPPLVPSQPATPATVPSQPSAPSSARQNKPKTLRLSSTAINDVPSPGIAPSPGSKQASRRPSITSLARPDTPASERISDTVSYTSASMSRANSPPPSRVGSAPTRRVTKSQQKKERQTRAKQVDDEAIKKEEEPAAKEVEPVVQAPIIGRKKKTKKAKETSRETANSTPSVTRPTSPELQELATKEEMPPPPQAGPEPVKTTKTNKETKKNIKLPTIEPIQPEHTPSIPPTPPIAADPNHGAQSFTPAKIFANLQSTREVLPFQIETVFKPVANNPRFDHNFDPELIVNGNPARVPLTPAQSAALDLGEPIDIMIDKNNAWIVLPDRRCLKGLTPLQAARFKDLAVRTRHPYQEVVRPSYEIGAFEHVLAPLMAPLLPPYNAASETPTPAAAASTQQQQVSSTATSLHNRFAEQKAQQLPPPLSVNQQSSILRQKVDPPLIPYHAPAKTLSVEEAEAALAAERKNCEGLEKRLNALIKKNRRLIMGTGN